MLKRSLMVLQALVTAGSFSAGPCLLSGCDSGSTEGTMAKPSAERDAALEKIRKETEAANKKNLAQPKGQPPR